MVIQRNIKNLKFNEQSERFRYIILFSSDNQQNRDVSCKNCNGMTIRIHNIENATKLNKEIERFKKVPFATFEIECESGAAPDVGE